MFDRYIALGDSISIDYYPQLDANRTDRIGAASLFYRNADDLWPEFARRDLVSIHPEAEFRNEGDGRFGAHGSDNLTADAAVLRDVLERQIPQISINHERTLVTLTAGGNDILSILHDPDPPRALVTGMTERLYEILGEIKRRREYALILVGTVYDPSDGTNILYGQRFDRHATMLREYNDTIRALEGKIEGVRVADIERHFRGHGLTAPQAERWYWKQLIFEPNARGASEVRRLFLEAIS